ncbi:response regulator [Bacillus sp. sid0103]|uniref:response regulator transcription factor n=1 Tax=Bacillus sp. sid0103 TaxID=2856337 RepID=UPI001C44D1A0|nr:response regulator [Bacillus sp. sid0103]MBV7508111.1 response regulator [Bacillus sp. sid0103]
MKRILLAEDEEVLRMLIVDIFENHDFLIDEAEDGQEALYYLKEHAYDLIILDYMMPLYTGFEVIEKVKLFEKNKNTKILMLSAKNQQNEREKVIKAGADHFMAKPFSPSQLLETVEEILNEK